MKTLGRIILLVVGGLLVGFAIPGLIDTINSINAVGWGNLFANYAANKTLISSLIKYGVNVIAGAFALLAGILGKGGFWLTLFSLIMIAAVTYYVVTAAQQGLFTDWKVVMKTIAGYALPICYCLGWILIKL